MVRILEGKKTQRPRKTKTKTLLLLVCLAVSLLALALTTTLVNADTETNIVTIYGETYDAGASKGDAVYGTARNSSTPSSYSDSQTATLVGQSTGYQVNRAWIYFDTTTIPDDAIIDNVTLSMKVATIYFPPAKDWNLSIQNGQPTYPHTPFDPDYDYYHLYYSGDGGNISTSEMSTETYFNITLTSTALDWIDVDGTTKLCLRSSADLNNTAPTGNDLITLYMAEAGTSDSPILYIGYTTTDLFTVNLYGPYEEDGTRDYAGINCTITRPIFAPINLELNGTYNNTIQIEIGSPIIITSEVSSNISRIYYLRYDQWYEDIYIFYPDALYATYYVTLVDYVGLTSGYLETLLNINGTDRVIERQKVDVVNAIPFILSWGTSYKIRLISDEGTYVWHSIIAGSDTTFSLVITSLQFPPDTISIGDITLSATRIEDITIQALYDDDVELTDWLYISFTELGETALTYSTNNTGNTQNITWSDALPTKDYVVYFEIMHQEEGILIYSIVVPILFEGDNPWDFSWLGDWGGIDTTQIIGVFIVLAVFGGFSIGSVDIGIMTMLITAGILIWMGWLSITWSFFTIVFCIGMLVVFSIRKKGTR